MRTIKVPDPRNDSLIAQLKSLYDTLKGFSKNEEVSLDLSSLSWIFPLLILPLTAYIKTKKITFQTASSTKIKQYLEAIGFPDGIESLSDFGIKLHRSKSYTPISVLKRETITERERLESLFSEKVYEILGSVPGAQNAVMYPISELVSNIFEHSKQNIGFVFGQFYPRKNFLDICIVDTGRGFASTYLEDKNLKFSDTDAIIAALQGNSVKSDKERGYGLRTSKDVICQGLNGGGFILISGSSGLVSVDKKESMVHFPGFYWQGVIIAYRIPKPKGPIDITQYLE